MKRKPCVCAPFTDPAIRDDGALWCEFLTLGQAAQLVVREERSSLRIDRLGPWDVARSRDVPWLLRLLLRQMRRRQQLAAILFRRPHVDETVARLAQNLMLDISTQGPNLMPQLCNSVSAGWCSGR